MVTIRKKISKPFLLIILAMPIAIIIIFNVIVSNYSKIKGEEEINKTVIAIANELDQDDTITLSAVMKTQLLNSGAQIIVYDKKGDAYEVLNKQDSFVNEELTNIVYEKIENLNYQQIYSFRHDSSTYYITQIEYNNTRLTDKVVYISKGLIQDEFVIIINVVLILVSIVITIIALVIAKRVTNDIVYPIEQISDKLKNMDSNKLEIIDTYNSTIEVENLTVEINKLNKRIKENNEKQKNFLQNASHELRTPLMSIEGYATGIEMGVFKDYKNTASLISIHSKRLTKIVDSLLKIARAENLNKEELIKINLSESIYNIIGIYQGYATNSKINIKTNIEDNVNVVAIEELLVSSIGNVLSNAIKYATSKIVITLKTKENEVIIQIKDDGKGIEDKSIIFKKFQKGKDGNYGLGLSIAKSSIDALNGTIKGHNNKGAIFEIRLNKLVD